FCARVSEARPPREGARKNRGEAGRLGRLPAGQAVDAIIAEIRTEAHRHAAELLTRDDVASLVAVLKQSRPALVEEVVPALVKPGELQDVLQELVREGVTICDSGRIVEAVGDAAARTKDVLEWAEAARSALARTLCRRH